MKTIIFSFIGSFIIFGNLASAEIKTLKANVMTVSTDVLFNDKTHRENPFVYIGVISVQDGPMTLALDRKDTVALNIILSASSNTPVEFQYESGLVPIHGSGVFVESKIIRGVKVRK